MVPPCDWLRSGRDNQDEEEWVTAPSSDIVLGLLGWAVDLVLLDLLTTPPKSHNDFNKSE